VLGYRDGPDVEFRMVFGWFHPGDAFADDADDAFVGRFEFIREF
jgi:hypothetical protein